MNRIIYIGNYLSEQDRTPNFNIYLAAKLESLGYQVIRTSSRRNYIFRIMDMWYTLFFNRKSTFMVFIDVFSTKAFWYAWTCAWLSRRFKLPYICIVRGGAIEKRLKQSPWFSRNLMGQAYMNVAPSLHHFELLQLQGFKTQYIPNFLELKTYPFKKRTHASPKLYWVRSLHKIYHPLMAVRLLERLLADYPEAKLTMVGPDKDGSLKEIKKYIHARGLKEHITLTGLLSKQQWHELSASHDIFLNTTSIDNHPVSVIEAMALGLPVISTNAGGLNQLLTHREDALLSDPSDEDLMLQHINEVLQDHNLCEKLSTQGRKRVEEFDWEQIKMKYLELFQGA